MFLIKQWMNRSGIAARFYRSGNCLFVDYEGCHRTAEVFVTMTGRNGNVAVATMNDDVPSSYQNYIKKWVKRNMSIRLRAR